MEYSLRVTTQTLKGENRETRVAFETPFTEESMAEPIQTPEVTFKESQIEADGFPIRYLQAGQGNTIVILDGVASGSSKLYDSLAQNYRVIVLELPGSDRSPANTNWRMRNFGRGMYNSAAESTRLASQPMPLS